MVEMRLVEIVTDEKSEERVFLLQERTGTRRVPIYVGVYEAEILNFFLRMRSRDGRPLVHDLILNTIEGLGGVLTGVVVDELRDNTFHAKLLVRTPDAETIRIDSRSSDALIVATRAAVPIYMEQQVLDETGGDDEE